MCCTKSLTTNHIFSSGAMYLIYNDNVTYRHGAVQKKLSHLMQCQSAKFHCAHEILSTMNFSKQKLPHFFLLIGESVRYKHMVRSDQVPWRCLFFPFLAATQGSGWRFHGCLWAKTKIFGCNRSFAQESCHLHDTIQFICVYIIEPTTSNW